MDIQNQLMLPLISYLKNNNRIAKLKCKVMVKKLGDTTENEF